MTPEENAERIDLIERCYAPRADEEPLTDNEADRLLYLQRKADQWVDEIEQLPIGRLERLLDRLKQKAR